MLTTFSGTVGGQLRQVSLYKIFTCLIYNRLAKYSELTLGEYQAGFRSSRSTTDQIYVVRQILGKCYEFGIELHNIFIDFKQSFDKVNTLKLYESYMLKISTKLIRLVKTTLSNSRAVVEVYQGRTHVFNINNGLRRRRIDNSIQFGVGSSIIKNRYKRNYQY